MWRNMGESYAAETSCWVLGNTLFKGGGNMPPGLDRQHNGGRQQERADGNVRDGGENHGEFRLN